MMQELIKKIAQWAIDRELDKKGTIEGQSIKTAEEIAELIKGISKDNIDLIKDSIGDVFVTLVIGNMLDKRLNLEEYCSQLSKHVEEGIFEEEILSGIKRGKKNEILALTTSMHGVLESNYIKELIFYTIGILMIIADTYNLDFKDCVESAYNEIANRKGKMHNGTFVKEGDY